MNKKTPNGLLLKHWRNLFPGHLFSKITQEILSKGEKNKKTNQHYSYKSVKSLICELSPYEAPVWDIAAPPVYVPLAIPAWPMSSWKSSSKLQPQPWGLLRTVALMASHHIPKSSKLRCLRADTAWHGLMRLRGWKGRANFCWCSLEDSVFKMIAGVWRGRSRHFVFPLFCLGLVASIQRAFVTSCGLRSLPFRVTLY